MGVEEGERLDTRAGALRRNEAVIRSLSNDSGRRERRGEANWFPNEFSGRVQTHQTLPATVMIIE